MSQTLGDAFVLLEVLFQSIEHSLVESAVADHDPAIVEHLLVSSEVQWLASDVTDASSCLLDDDRPGGVIPDVLAVGQLLRIGKTKVERRLSTGHQSVFHLGVHADRRRLDADATSDLVLSSLISVAALDALGETELSGLSVGDRVDPSRLSGMKGPDGLRIRSLPTNSVEEKSTVVVQGRTGEDTDFHLAIDDQSQGNGVLISTEEALGSI